MDELIKGVVASDLFGEILSSNPTFTSRDLCRLLVDRFPEIDGAAIQLIRRWKGVGRVDGISDADLNIGIAHFLKEAGYLNTD
ncbi:hypothetical protein [Paraburkholderia sp. 32]